MVSVRSCYHADDYYLERTSPERAVSGMSRRVREKPFARSRRLAVCDRLLPSVRRLSPQRPGGSSRSPRTLDARHSDAVPG
jgi:hypothetical protein